MLLTGGFVVVEVAGGILSGSLALLADAGHMLTDTAALWLAWMAFRVSHRPSDERRSYGYKRFQVLAALLNGVAFLVIVGWIGLEAVGRMTAPVTVDGELMLAVGGAGLVVNLLAFYILGGGDRDNLNMGGAVLHVLGDLLGSAAAIAAAVVILATGWMPIDPLLSLLVALLILRSGWRLVAKSVHILLEGTPDWLDVPRLQKELIAAVPGVRDIHHVHAWSLTQEQPLLTLHASLHEGMDGGQALAEIKNFLKDGYGIAHSTVQIEPDMCVDD
jgi:cobalt-zinc-cadmium efflux system protein